DVGGVDRELDFDGGDGMDGVGLPDGGGVDFAEADPAYFPFGDVFCDCGDRFGEGDVRVDTARFEYVDGFFGAGGEDGEAFVDGAADVGTGAVDSQGAIGDASALDGEGDPWRRCGVSGEVAGEEVQRVGMGRAVDFAAVPKGGVRCKGSV
ncbi:MAG: hypothetical protein Q9205_006411, partial [Flavoplaca limonia]